LIVLVINSGSSSLKYQLFNMQDRSVMAKGICECIGTGGRMTHKRPGMENYTVEVPLPTHDDAIELLLKVLTDREYGVIKDISEIGAVGHRIAHGGEKYKKSAIIDSRAIKELEELNPINPLHGPPIIKGIKACLNRMPDTPQVGVFDTSYYSDLPDYRYIYPLPYELYTEKKIRRYGFHGTSHRYVAAQAARYMGRELSELKIITCHLGNGSSVTATAYGKAVDTSMGFTPQEGAVMGTRSGSIDPSIIPFLMKTDNLTPEQVEEIINKKSGLLGISGISNDAREVNNAADNGNYRAQLALKILGNSVKKLIGAYVAEMNGLDALVFTAGIGENDFVVRRLVCEEMDYLGIAIDEEKNRFTIKGKEGEISAPGARVRTFVIPTNEELMIALDTCALVR
jgi:acetate kinase